MGISVLNPAAVSASKTKKGQSFTSSGSWTAPTGVTFVTVYCLGGGGGGGETANTQDNFATPNAGDQGGNSSFGSLVTSGGGPGGLAGKPTTNITAQQQNGVANSGVAGRGGGQTSNSSTGPTGLPGINANPVIASLTVVAGTTYSITVGNGGAGGAATNANCRAGSNGGSGFVNIGWEE